MKTMTKTINGFNTEAIGATVAAIQENPAIGNFELRATNQWISGAHNRSYVQGFYGAGMEDTSRTEPFVIDIDEPPVLLGANMGTNPGEVLLYGLLGCMTTAIVLLAAAHGIEVKSVSSKIEGDVDLKGFLGLDPTIAKEFTQLRVAFEIDGVSDEEKEQLLGFAKMSPVFNSLIHPIDVQVSGN